MIKQQNQVKLFKLLMILIPLGLVVLGILIPILLIRLGNA
jgi:hypothetical protein